MPDLRARLVALLYEHQEGATANLNLGRDECRCGEQGMQGWREHFADVVLALPGVAVVELPEQTNIPADWTLCKAAWPTGGPYGPVSLWPSPSRALDPDEIAMPGGDWIPVDEARALAAALLAAADATEAVER